MANKSSPRLGTLPVGQTWDAVLPCLLMSRSGGGEWAGVLFTRNLGLSPHPGSAWLRVLRWRWLSSSHTELSVPASVSEAPHSPPALGPLPSSGPAISSVQWHHILEACRCSAAAHRAGVGDRRGPGLLKGEDIGRMGVVATSGSSHLGALSSPKA